MAKKEQEIVKKVKKTKTVETEFTYPKEKPHVLAGKGSAWHIVTNNPTFEDWERLRQRECDYSALGVWNDNDVVYEMWALENETQNFMQQRMGIKLTPHFQTAIVFRKPQTFQKVRSMFPRSHVEPVRRDFVSNYLYISKQAKLQSYGEIRNGMLHWPIPDKDLTDDDKVIK